MRLGYASTRFKTCKSCDYSRKSSVLGLSVLTCGEFITGGLIKHEGETVNLCGCVLKAKTLVPTEHCPIKKW